MDLWHKILNFLDHERGKVIGLVIAALLASWIVGCQPTTTSTLDPERTVTPPELAREVVITQGGFDKRADVLNADIATYNQTVEVAEADLEAKFALRTKIIEVVGGLGTAIATGGFSAPAAIGSIIQLAMLGLVGGSVVDTVRKNKVITTLKNGDSPAPN